MPGDLVSASRPLFSFVYAELRRRADRYVRRENPGHTLQPTDLVHEAYLRLSAQNPGWKNRVQFFAVASQMMRRILVDHARARRAAKRPDRTIQVTFGEAPGRDPREVDVIALGEAVEALAKGRANGSARRLALLRGADPGGSCLGARHLARDREPGLASGQSLVASARRRRQLKRSRFSASASYARRASR